jgi:sugar-specific transcriptional regulator TrmB
MLQFLNNQLPSMKTELKELLNALALNEIEIKVFLINLETGPAVASEIAESAGLNRVTTYEALKRLSKKGLVTIRAKKNNRIRYFQAEDIEVIREKLEKRKMEIEATIGKAIDLKEQFRSLYALRSNKPSVLFYEGRDGIKKVLEDTLRQKPQEILSFASAAALKAGFEDKFLDNYWKKRVVLKIPSRGILPESEGASPFTPERNRKELRRIKFMPPTLSLFENETDIYGDNVAIISLAKNNEYGVLIRSKSIAESLRALYECFWNLLPDRS